MNDEQDGHEHDEQGEQAERMRQAIARSELLRAKFLAVLNDPAETWGDQPMISAHGAAETLWSVMAYILRTDPGRVPWAFELCERLRARVEEAAVCTAAPGERTH